VVVWNCQKSNCQTWFGPVGSVANAAFLRLASLRRFCRGSDFVGRTVESVLKEFPKAVAKIVDDLEELLAFYDFPAEHWVHLRTTNPIESTFATVRHRTKVTKGPGSKAAGIAMAFKLIEAAQHRWRAVNAPHLVALVGAGARFERGKFIERETEETATEAA